MGSCRKVSGSASGTAAVAAAAAAAAASVVAVPGKHMPEFVQQDMPHGAAGVMVLTVQPGLAPEIVLPMYHMQEAHKTAAE